MSAIYQRARPLRWEDVIGQEHVKDVLRAALSQGRVGHAYLFSGPRGVGKTTTARLIAMTANCTGPLPKPCGECESCLSVRAGSHPDVMEIDAASNNSVDDVRDLREKVSLAAMHGGKKIYILDEAHMMSRAAFNALLKTLEEPPSHVIFILATTEPEKIIPTILSRCQHYRFRRLTPQEIAGKLAGVAAREGVTAEPEALELIGRLADGAMRDGESLLERMLAAGSAVTRAGVEDALGLPPGERVRAIAAALVSGDAGAALSGAAALYRDGFAARTVVEGLVGALGAALHAELGLGEGGMSARLEGADIPRLLKLQAALDEQDARFARAADQQSLELALTHALLATGGGGGAPGGAGAGAGAGGATAEVTQRLNRLEKELAALRAAPPRPASVTGAATGPSTGPGTGPATAAPAPARSGSGPAAPAAPVPEEAAGPGVPAAQGHWADVVRQASIQLRAFLKPARMHAEPGYVSLSYDDRNAFHARQVAAKFDDIARIAARVFGPVTFELVAPEGGRRVNLAGTGGGTGSPRPAARTEAVQTEDVPSAGGPSVGPQPVAAQPTEGQRPPDQGPADQSPADQRPAVQSAPPAPREPDIAPFNPGRSGPPPRRAPEGGGDAPLNGSVPPARPAPVATLSRPPERRVAPHSPDDVAPAPLPSASGPLSGAATPAGQASAGARELYLVEPITEEPDWDAFGAPAVLAGLPPEDDMPFGPATSSGTSPAISPAAGPATSPTISSGAPAPRPAAPERTADPELRSAPDPQTVPGSRTAADARAGATRPGDIRAHPMYEDIRGRFGGRVREIGKNRSVPPAVSSDASEDEDTDT